MLQKFLFSHLTVTFSALMLLVGWQKWHPACKKLSGAVMVICLERGAGLHMAQLMLLSCFSKIQIGFTFLALADLGSPGQQQQRPFNGL